MAFCTSTADAAVTFVVNSTLDAVDASPGDGVCATASSVCTLRAAIQEVNAQTGDAVVTLPPGLYQLTIPGRNADVTMGDLNVAQAVSLTINGAGAGATIIDGGYLDRIFDVTNATTLTVSDLTLQHGGSFGDPGTSGGCIQTAGNLTVVRSVVRNCSGGSFGSGGGIYANVNTGAPFVSIIDSAILDNAGYNGGGLAVAGAGAEILRTTIAGNSATHVGGGLRVTQTFFGHLVTIENSTIAENVAPGSAAVYADGKNDVVYYSSTIVRNIASSGGAIDFGQSEAFFDTLIANNAPANCARAGGDGGHNLEFPGTSCGFALDGDIRADPMISTLAFNGGVGPTVALLPGSPAIDAGDDTQCGSVAIANIDQRGVSRTARAGAHCDIGAFEHSTIAPLDFDLDGRSDRTVFRPSTGVWYDALTTGSATATTWGQSGDIPVAGDYDGDGKADLAVWRPSTGEWRIVQSTDNTVRVIMWGVNGDIPLSGDVDGDGKADLVIWRPNTGKWYARLSASGYTGVIEKIWGVAGDVPLLEDIDGDHRADFVIYRPGAAAVWYVALTAGGYQNIGWGITGDIPIQGDRDGDGKADPTIFRPSTGQWYVLGSAGSVFGTTWGTAGDVPVAGDEDGDGKSDFIIWRPSSGVWYTQFAAGGFAAVGWGLPADLPIGSAPSVP